MRAFDQAFGKAPHTVCYSVKANSNLSILRLLAKMGCGFDVVSGGELERVLRAAPKAAKNVVFSGVGKTSEEMRLALQAGILLFNVESEAELQALAECCHASEENRACRVACEPRCSGGNASIHFNRTASAQVRDTHRAGAGSLQESAESRFLSVRGVSVHIGSQITDMTPFTDTMQRVADLVRACAAMAIP